jgi:hypothetical protein
MVKTFGGVCRSRRGRRPNGRLARHGAAGKPMPTGLYLGWLGKQPGHSARSLCVRLLHWVRPTDTAEAAEVSERAIFRPCTTLRLRSRCPADSRRCALPHFERDAVALAGGYFAIAETVNALRAAPSGASRQGGERYTPRLSSWSNRLGSAGIRAGRRQCRRRRRLARQPAVRVLQ